MERITKNDILAYLERNKQLFREQFGVVCVGIFGSFVRDEQTSQSDIDVIIKMEEDRKNIHNFLNFKRFLEKELGVRVDLGLESTIKPLIKEEIKDEIIYV